MLFLAFICVSICLSTVFAQFTIISDTCHGMIVGVGASGLYALAPASNTDGTQFVDVGVQSEKSALPDWTSTKVGQGLSLDGAINSLKESYLASLGAIRYSNDSITYTAVKGLVGTSQSLNFLADDDTTVAAVGTFSVKDGKRYSFVSGVALAKAGVLTSISEVPVTESSLRYGSFPSSSTWYVSSGLWPADNSTALANSDHKFTKRFTVNTHAASTSQDTLSNDRKLQSGENWIAEVLKTSDAGKTWTKVFSSPSDADYYFNEISCGSIDSCVVVGEGNNADGSPIAVAFTTTDGGVTWVQTLNTVGTIYSLTSVKMIDSKVGYIGASMKSGFSLVGTFYYTEDGGMTWVNKQQLKGCDLILDIDFNADGSAGYATCMSASGTSACVAENIAQ